MKITDYILGQSQKKVVEAAAEDSPQVKALDTQIANLEQQLDNLKKQRQEAVASAQAAAKTNESIVSEASGTKWSSKVTANATSHSKPGLYASGSASQIASAELSREGSPGKAIKAVEFYLNRAGSNLSDARKAVIKNAVKILQAKNKKKS